MNLLLDTHALLWWLADDSALPASARELITDPDSTVYLSAVVMWEIRIKQAIGKLIIPEDFRRVVDDQGFTELPVTIDHTDALAALPMHHRDPFDRLLIAQAVAEGLTIVSVDESLRQYQVPVVPS